MTKAKALEYPDVPQVCHHCQDVVDKFDLDVAAFLEQEEAKQAKIVANLKQKISKLQEQLSKR